MPVKIIILRKVPHEKDIELKPLLNKLRSYAMAQPGYISGETLMNADDPEEYLVISTWKTIEDWNTWLSHEQRAEVQSEIDKLLGRETMYQVYYNG